MKVDTADEWDANQGSEEHVEDVCGQDGRCQTAILYVCVDFCNSNSFFFGQFLVHFEIYFMRYGIMHPTTSL